MNESPKPDQEYRYKWYLDRVAEKRQWAERLSENQDRLIFTFSTGALILSVNFFDKVIGHDVRSLYLLRASWILLIVSAISVLISLQAASSSTLTDKLRLDEWFENGAQKALDFPPTYKHRITRIADILAKIALVAGVSLMTYFASINMNTMNQPQNQQPDPALEKSMPSFSVPLPPPASQPAGQPTSSPAQGNS